MAGNVRRYYAGGNTAKGFFSLFDSALQGLNRLYILKGGPGTGKSTIMQKIGEEMVSRGYDVEIIHCASDNHSIDGVIVTDLQVGVVDGTAPHVIEPKAPGAIDEYVNLGTTWNSDKLIPHKKQIIDLNKITSEYFQKAYDTFSEALTIHDEWEKIYIDNLDRSKADQVTQDMIQACFSEQTLKKKANMRHLFLGAATPEGPVDFIQNLTASVSKRYFIKGRPGSGKSTMLKKLVSTAEERGFDVEVYHCGFDPRSLDMLVFPELSIAIFDSTAPHEHFPERESDEIIDLYQLAVKPGTDEKYEAALKDIQGRYKAKMKEATDYLTLAKSWRDKLESYYIEAIDFRKVDQIHHDLQSAIDRIAESKAKTSALS